ncbi:MAG: YceD family protein [Mycobacteriales bacterium]
MKNKPTSSLDPRAPLVLDTRELGRRPGSMRRLHRTVPAPAELRVGLVGVPVGAPVELDLRLESVMDGVLVSGTVRAPLAGECARCLDPLTSTVEADLQELYAYPETAAENGPGGDDELPHLSGDLLDLEPLVRDEIVLAAPLIALCDDDCMGLCPTCGIRLADADAGHGHELADSRWAALQLLRAPADAMIDQRPTEPQER